jgi:hypothetical protein
MNLCAIQALTASGFRQTLKTKTNYQTFNMYSINPIDAIQLVRMHRKRREGLSKSLQLLMNAYTFRGGGGMKLSVRTFLRVLLQLL